MIEWNGPIPVCPMRAVKSSMIAIKHRERPVEFRDCAVGKLVAVIDIG